MYKAARIILLFSILLASCNAAPNIGARSTGSHLSTGKTAGIAVKSAGQTGQVVLQTVHAFQAPTGQGIHKIRHVVIIMQENHSFDNYFGTFPGADGIPMKNGIPTVCIPNPATKNAINLSTTPRIGTRAVLMAQPMRRPISTAAK